MSEIVSFGDDFNRYRNFNNCGVGVAVANACEEAKFAADYIYESNNEDGMANGLRRIFCPYKRGG